MVPIPQSAINRNVRQANVPRWLTLYAAGSVLVGKRNIVLLDAARLLFSDQMQHFFLEIKCSFTREKDWWMSDTPIGGITENSLLIMQFLCIWWGCAHWLCYWEF